ncbi:MAG: ribonuclease H-like domain-containing protein [SAR324 cluster bacterium]|nr:ribonuclease H-like domain-containing protein [SAR324 cluster bacterium]MBF0350651.1 ribonuclease H-like domain-containing protein [SAR324 cluster bacterium]
MLQHTFCHLPAIGPQSEKKFWDQGIRSWKEFLQTSDPVLTRRQQEIYHPAIRNSFDHLQKNHPQFFAQRLASAQHWRLYSEFRNSVAYLDIETTGLTVGESEITTIAVYDGKKIFHYVNGINLQDFPEDIKKYSLLVTFCGKNFDVPFIQAYFGIKLPHSHIDLRNVLRSLGYKGGLKKCEKEFGLDRKELDGIDGLFAVLLWNEYIKNKNQHALDTLLAYNIEDVVNLEPLMVMTYNLKLKETPFGNTLNLSVPPRPAIPFQPHMPTVRNLLRQSRPFDPYARY